MSTPLAPSRWRAVAAPVVASVLAVGVAVVAALGALQFTGWQWAALAAAGVVSLVIAAPGHLAAARAWRRPTSPAVLASVAALAALAFAAVSVLDGLRTTSLAAAAVPGALLTIGESVRSGAGLAPEESESRPFAGLLAVVALGSAVWIALRGIDQGATVAVAATVGLAAAAHLLAPGLALVVGRRRAAALGVRLDSLEATRRAAGVDTVVLDQDGTVTTGQLRVTSVDPLEPDHDRNLRWFAGALSHAGDHPISKAIAQLSARGHVAGVEVLDGQGVAGSVDRHPVRVGSPSWLGAAAPDSLWRTVGVEVDARFLGTLTIADDVRDRASEGVRALQDLGLDVRLASTSRPDRAEHVAQQVGLERVHLGAPAELARELSASGRTVALASTVLVDDAVALSTTPETGGLVLDDLDVRRVGHALAAARAVTAAVARGRAVATIGTCVGVAAALVGATGPDLTASIAALCTAATAVAATR